MWRSAHPEYLLGSDFGCADPRRCLDADQSQIVWLNLKTVVFEIRFFRPSLNLSRSRSFNYPESLPSAAARCNRLINRPGERCSLRLDTSWLESALLLANTLHTTTFVPSARRHSRSERTTPVCKAIILSSGLAKMSIPNMRPVGTIVPLACQRWHAKWGRPLLERTRMAPLHARNPLTKLRPLIITTLLPICLCSSPHSHTTSTLDCFLGFRLCPPKHTTYQYAP